uniref:Crp/Fnr family transcriptional regulator n=1 Tax=Pararhizobium sp. IMCC3301 TaxID=3067904 RepID=UPI002741188D|nr:Crp/Fnr family transcriptional regulator [Pararhizobium sp. IMCC3301]
MLDVSLIANLPPFADIAKDALQDLLKQAKPVRFNRNDYIFSAGEPADSFFLLLDGYIRVVRVTPDGEQVIARYISAGELFGVAQALGRDTYPANAVAAADCVVLRWPGDIWPEVISRSPTFATNTYHMVGERLQDAQDRIVEMATERVEQRVAHAIVKLADQTGRKTDDGIVIDFPLSRQDISEMTGTTLHTVSRLMSAWEQAGMVKSGRQKITVTEHDRLVTLANHPKE